MLFIYQKLIFRKTTNPKVNISKTLYIFRKINIKDR